MKRLEWHYARSAAAGALYIVNKMCVDGLRNVEGWNKLMIMSIVTRAEEECLQFLMKRR